MKRNIKRWLAVLCAIVMLPWGMWVSTEPQEVKAAVTDTTLETMEKWTIADATNVPDGTYGTFTAQGLSGTMIGTAFKTKIKFDTEGNIDTFYVGTGANRLVFQYQTNLSQLQIGHFRNNAWQMIEGFNTVITAGVRNVERISPSALGLSTFTDQEIEMLLTFEEIEGSTDTVSLGIYFNGTLYRGQKFVMGGTTTDLIKGVSGVVGTGETGNTYLAAVKEVLPDDLEKWAIDDAGLSNGTYGTFAGTGLSGTAIGTAFTTMVKFDTEGVTDTFYIGTSKNRLVIQYNTTTASLQIGQFRNNAWAAIDGFSVPISSSRNVERISASTLGLTTFKDQELKLMVSFEAIEDDSEHVLMGVWFDDTLYRGRKFVMGGTTADLIKGVSGVVGTGETGNTYLAVPEDMIERETIPENLEKWTIRDAGLADGTYGTFSGTGLEGPMVGSAFVTNIKFDTEGNRDVLYIGTAANRLVFEMQSETQLQIGFFRNNGWSRIEGFNTRITDTRNVERINASDLGLTTFKDKEFRLTLTYEAIEGNTDAVMLGIWFDDVLWREKFVMTGSSTELIKGISGIAGNGEAGNTYLATPEDLIPEEPEPDTIPENLERWNIAHAGLADGTYGTFSGTGLEGPMVGSAFLTMVKFDTEGNKDVLYIGTNANRLAFQMQSETMLQIGFAVNGAWSMIEGFNTTITAGVRNVERINASDLGLTTFKDQELKLALTYEAIEGRTDAVLLGIWFNDTLWREKFVMTGSPTELVKGISGLVGTGEAGNTYLAVPAGEMTPQPPTVPATIEKWTIVDVGLADGTHGDIALNETSQQIVGSAFTTYLRFDDTIATKYALKIGGAEDYLILQPQNETMLQFAYVKDGENSRVEGWNFTVNASRNVERINASDLGFTTFKNQDLKLTLTFEVINGSADTALFGIWFNDTLWEKYTMNVNNEKFFRGISAVSSSANIYLAEPKYGDVNFDDAVGSVDLVIAKKILAKGWYSPSLDRFNDGTSDGYDFRMIQRFVAKESLAEDYHTELTFVDYGCDTTLTVKNPDDKAIRPIGDDVKHESLDGVVIKGNYILSGTNPYFCIGNKNGGVQFYIEEGHLVYCYQDNNGTNKDTIKHETTNLVPIEAVGTSYLDTVIPIQTGFTFMNTSSDGLSTDVIVDVKIGNSYSKTFRVDGVQTSNLQRVIYLNAANSADNSVTLYPEVATLSFDAIGGKDVMPIGGYYGPAVEGIAGAGDVTSFDHFTAATFNDIKAAGVNLLTYVNLNYNEYTNRVNTYVLDLAGNRGMGVFVMDLSLTDQEYDKTGVAQDYGKYLTTDEQAKEQLAKYSSHKAFAGLHVADEPKSDNWMSDSTNKDISYYADAYKRLSELGVVGSSNLFPLKSADGLTETDYENYKQYVEEYCSTCAPSYLCFDYYVWDPSSTGVTQAGYFRNMSIIREKAQEYQIPFWSFVQAGTHWNDGGVKPTLPQLKPRDPDEGEFLWSVNTALACGAKGINYFPLIQKEVYATDSNGNKTIFDFNGLLGADGSKNKWYGYAQTANKQIAAADEYLMNAISDGIIVSGTSATNDTTAFTDRITGTAYNELTGVSGDAIIGCFNYAGKTALYVANYDSDNAQDITLTFDGDYTVTCVDGGVKSDLAITGSGTQLSLVAGEGVLLVFDK